MIKYSFVDQTTSNIEHQLISNKNEKERNEVGAFNLVEYIENLKQERKDWHQEYRNRKCQRKDLAKQKACIEHQGQIMDMNVLTEYERAFLIGRPDYELICRNTQKLHDMTLKISMLNQLVHKVNQRFVNCMEKNIVLSIKEIIKMSEY